MKKIIKLIGVLLLCLPTFVLADCTESEIYDAIITKSDGLTVECSPYELDDDGDEYANTDKKGYVTIPKGSVIKNVSEIYYGDIDIYFDYNNQYCTTNSVDGFEGISTNIKISDYAKLKSASIVRVISSKGTSMYAGPGLGFKKLDTTIPKDTVLSYEYLGKKYDTFCEEELTLNECYEYLDTGKYHGNDWYYVEYDGVRGWINKLNGEIAYKLNYTSITGHTLNIVGDNTDVVEANTILRNVYSDDKNIYALYNDHFGKVNGFVAKELSETYTDTLTKDTNLYETVSTDSNVITTIKKGTKFKSNLVIESSEGASDDFTVSIIYYIEYDGNKGWIYVDEEGSSKSLTYNDKSIKKIFGYDISELNKSLVKEESSEDIIEAEEVEEALPAPKVEEEVVEERTSKKQIIIYSVIGVFVILLIVILILIIRKKKNKVNLVEESENNDTQNDEEINE